MEHAPEGIPIQDLPDEFLWGYHIFKRQPSGKHECFCEKCLGQRNINPPTLTEKQIEFYRLLAKILIQVISSKIDFNDAWWYLLHEAGRDDFVAFVHQCLDKKCAWNYIKDIVEKYYDTNEYCFSITYAQLTELFPYEVISGLSELEALCDTVIAENPKSVTDYKKGKTNSINHLKGQIMKLTKGKADAKVITEILERKLKA